MTDNITLEVARKPKAGYWATIRDADNVALFNLALRGYNTRYTRDEVVKILRELVMAIKEDRFDWREGT